MKNTLFGCASLQSRYTTSPFYPNPTQSEMTVTTNNFTVKIAQMKIYDVYGKDVSLQTVN